MNQYHVYILLCRDGSYYTGITNNIERRIIEHEYGEDPKWYTFKRRPLKLVFNEIFSDVNQAIAFEKQVKGWKRAKKEAIIAGRWDLLPELSRSSSAQNGSTGSPWQSQPCQSEPVEDLSKGLVVRQTHHDIVHDVSLSLSKTYQRG